MGRFFLQFGEDLFGFVTYGFLMVQLPDLFHLSIRGVLQLRNVVLMCISSLIKLNLWTLPSSTTLWPCVEYYFYFSNSVSMAPYEFDKHSLLFICLPNPF